MPAACQAAEAAYAQAVGRQMLVLAVRLEDLKWKRAYRGIGGGRPEWEEAIARDEARLERGRQGG